MNLIPLILLAVAVLPSDRLQMADRLFNKGQYKDAKAEYMALRNAPGIAGDELLFRLAETNRLLGDTEKANAEFRALLERFPSSKYVHRSRLVRALALKDKNEKIKELKLLDNDTVDAQTRAAALYNLGTLTRDAEVLRRSIQLEPKGRYADYASFHRAAILTESDKDADRREAINELLKIAFGGNAQFQEEALYLASVQNYSSKRYDESVSLFNRYLKLYPKGKHVESVRTASAWCNYLTGRYSDAIQIASNQEGDDLAYLLAASTQAIGSAEEAHFLYKAYLDKYPMGRNRTNAELAVSRMNFTIAEKSGDIKLAIESAKKAHEISKSVGDYLRLAWAYEKNSQLAEAQAIYLDIRRSDPDSSEAMEAMYRKAMLDMRVEKWSAAEMGLAEVLSSPKVGSRKASALFWRAIAAIRLEHEQEGARYLKEALELGLSLDEQREARLLMADIAFESGRDEEAKAEYEKIVFDGGCDRMSAAKTLAVGKLIGGKGAKICAESLIKNDSPEWRQAGYVLLGVSEEESEAYIAAIDAYRNAMAIPVVIEDIASASLRLGRLEMKLGEYDKADATLRKSVEYNSKSPRERAEAYLLLAENSALSGDMKSARGYATVVTTLFDDAELIEKANKILEK